MTFVVKTAKTVRNHWKKSIAFTFIGIYGVKYLNDRYEEDLLRRKYCEEARVYGDQVCDLAEKNRRITIFLNPAARGGRSRKLFEKNAAPILYVAGIECNVVKTEYEGQVKEFFKYLESEHVDGVVVAGGNGTLLETITGLMRKDDKTFCRKVPIGVIPVGDTNRFASFFYGSDKTEVRCMLDAAMAVVRGDTERLDVLKIEGEGGKTTYALCGLEAGAYRDARERTDKYWYFGPLKHRFTYLRTVLRAWPPTLSGTIEYTEARETDVPVQVEKQAPTTSKPSSQRQSWLAFFMSPFMAKKAANISQQDEGVEEEVEYENLHTQQRELKTFELNITSNFTNPSSNQHMKGVGVEIGPAETSKTDFISEGWSRISSPKWKFGSEQNEKLQCRNFKFTPTLKEGEERWYTIDGEMFEAMPIEVTLLKNRLKIYKRHSLPT